MIDSLTTLIPKHKLQNQKEQVILVVYSLYRAKMHLFSIHITTESLAYLSSNLIQLHLKLG